MGKNLHGDTEHGNFQSFSKMQARMENEHVLPGWGTSFHPNNDDFRFQLDKFESHVLKSEWRHKKPKGGRGGCEAEEDETEMDRISPLFPHENT